MNTVTKEKCVWHDKNMLCFINWHIQNILVGNSFLVGFFFRVISRKIVRFTQNMKAFYDSGRMQRLYLKAEHCNECINKLVWVLAITSYCSFHAHYTQEHWTPYEQNSTTLWATQHSPPLTGLPPHKISQGLFIACRFCTNSPSTLTCKGLVYFHF